MLNRIADTRWRVFVYAVVPALALLAAWLSGFIETSSLEYGFPLPWKTLVLGTEGCPRGPLLIACMVRLWPQYDWPFFVLDTAFYLTLSYALVVAGRRTIAKPVSWRTLHLPIQG